MADGPILNSPFTEPERHRQYDEGSKTFVKGAEGVRDGRRAAVHYIPVPAPRKKGQAALDIAEERVVANEAIGRLRAEVSLWRRTGYPGATNVSRRLLRYWSDPTRTNRLFFAQIEALETLVYLHEGPRERVAYWRSEFKRANDGSNPGLQRLACKMATGAGKTVVMAMIVVWHTLNRADAPPETRDRYAEAFLFIAPGVTIRDRLGVLKPNTPGDYYTMRDLVPAEDRLTISRARVHIVNFHTFKPGKKMDLKGDAQALLRPREEALRESPADVAARVLRPLALAKREPLVVLSDEAHHCYDVKPKEAGIKAEKLSGEDLKEAKKANERARLWINGVRALVKRAPVVGLYDLSATPYFLRGSGYVEGTLFPWVVSDFDLVEAVEAGIVKVPTVPTGTNATEEDERGPVHRNLYAYAKDALPKKGDPYDRGELTRVVEAAAIQLYASYERAHREAVAAGGRPPVFIVVCNHTTTSRMMADYLGGYLSDDGRHVPGRMGLFDNSGGDLRTLLVDSEALDSGEKLPDDFLSAAAEEVAILKAKLPHGRKLETADLLREVLNTVGKPGALGEGVRCVVSVNMLTEGWDVGTVTHILGLRAFGTTLLCEQVIGRGLRRASYEADESDRFEVEVAEVYGVPFAYLDGGVSGAEPKPPKAQFRVRALPSRAAEAAMAWPVVLGYRRRVSPEPLTAAFTDDHAYRITPGLTPTETLTEGIGMEGGRNTLDPLRDVRMNAIVHELARRVLLRFAGEDHAPPHWRFPAVVRACRTWVAERLTCSPEAFEQMLGLHYAEAAERIARGLTFGEGASVLLPVLAPEPERTTEGVDFFTSRARWETGPRCHLDHVVLDSGWEGNAAFSIEGMGETLRYVRCAPQVGFRIPYFTEGARRWYIPDFLVDLNDGVPDPLHAILEVTGRRTGDKEVRVLAGREWVAAINAHGAFGRWTFAECHEPDGAAAALRSAMGKDPVLAAFLPHENAPLPLA